MKSKLQTILTMVLALELATPAMAQAAWSDKVIPNHGNYGGPGWTGGQWDDGSNSCKSTWKPPVDEMDRQFRNHDYDYIRSGVTANTPNTNPAKQAADQRLLDGLQKVQPSTFGGQLYKAGAQGYFRYKVNQGNRSTPNPPGSTNQIHYGQGNQHYRH